MNIKRKLLIFVSISIASCFSEDYKRIAIQPELAYLHIENPLQMEDGRVSVDLRLVNNTKFDFLASDELCGIIGENMSFVVNVEALIGDAYQEVRGYGAIFESPLSEQVLKSGESLICTLTLDDKFAIDGHRKLKVSLPSDKDSGFIIKGKRALAQVESNELYFEVLRPTKYNKNIFNTDHLKPVPTTPLPLEDSN